MCLEGVPKFEASVVRTEDSLKHRRLKMYVLCKKNHTQVVWVYL